MTPQEANLLRWMDAQDRPVSDTEIKRQFPRLWLRFTVPLLQHGQIEQDGRYYRLTSLGRRDLIAFETGGQTSAQAFAGRKEI